LDIAQWLLSVKPDIDISVENEYAFTKTCENGHLDIAQWLLSVNPHTDISVENEYAFRWACENGHFSVAKWLLQIKPDIDISAKSEHAFRGSCWNGHLELAQWLLQIKPDIDVSAEDEEAFRYVCGNGHLEVAEWLLDIHPNLDISVQNDEAFRWACENRHVNIAIWFTRLDSKYMVELNHSGYIQSYYVKRYLPIVHNIKIDGETIEEKMCPICYEENVSIQTNCSHNYCVVCLSNYYHKSTVCPYCRTEITSCYEISGVPNLGKISGRISARISWNELADGDDLL
jgi:hypothetical protein